MMHGQQNVKFCTSIYNSLPEDEPSGSKHVEDIKKLKIKILISKMCILSVCIVWLQKPRYNT